MSTKPPDDTCKPTCPGCCEELIELHTPKDIYASNGDEEVYLGRLICEYCPTCRYVGNIWQD